MKKVKIVLAVILFLLIYFIIDTLKTAGALSNRENHFDGSVEVIESPPGVEDIAVDHTNNYAYLSSHNRWNFSDKGDLYLYKLNDSIKTFINITKDTSPKDFRPHGISLINIDSTNYLFVVSHGDANNTVERFKIQGEKAIHQKTFTDPSFVSLNDVVALGLDEFYVTNDHSREKGLIRQIGDFLRYPSGNVVHYNKEGCGIIFGGLIYPNGVNVSLDKKWLYVASTTAAKLMVFDLSTNTLFHSQKLGVPPDNIDVDPKGFLWVGTQPNLIKFLGHSGDPKKKAPSGFLKMVFQPETGYKFLQEGLFHDDGQRLSASSVATYANVNGKSVILMGGVFDSKILWCTRK